MTERPSEILRSAFSLHDAQDFHGLLENGLYPFLDSLPATYKQGLVNRLEIATEAFHGRRTVALERRSTSIQDGLKDIRICVQIKRSGREPEEDPGDERKMMVELVNQIANWLPDLWAVGVEQSAEHTLVHESLKICHKAIDDLASMDSDAEFGDVNHLKIKIEEANGKVVYSAPLAEDGVDHAMFWVWRDLLLSTALVPKTGTKLVQKMVADLEQMDLLPDMLVRLEEKFVGLSKLQSQTFKGTDNAENRAKWEEDEKRGYLLLNGHLPSEMRSVIPKVRDMIVTRLVADFKKDPSPELFNSLLSSMPLLRDGLLDVARKRYLQQKGKRSATLSAFQIFESAEADQELLELLNMVKAGKCNSDVTEDVRRSAIAYLGARPRGTRIQVRPHLEHGLLCSVSYLMEEINRVFPVLSDAWEYLQEEIKNKNLTKIAPASPKVAPAEQYVYSRNNIHPRQPDPTRDPVLKLFREKAGWAPSREIDEDDGCSEDSEGRTSPAAKEDIKLKVITSIQKWAAILEEWPNKTEQNALKKTVREAFKGGQHFFDVDGVADILARRCDYGVSWPCRQRLGRAIRELYYNFAVDGAEKGRIKADMPEEMTFFTV